MTQVERDLTYRRDALVSICTQYGTESQECKASTEMWEKQHTMNLWTEVYSSWLFWVIGGVLVFWFVFPRMVRLWHAG